MRLLAKMFCEKKMTGKVIVHLLVSSLVLCMSIGCRDSDKEQKLATITDSDLVDAVKIWKSSDSVTPETRAKAAHTIVKYMERNEHKWLILGNVIAKLGQPSSVATDIYVFDEVGNVMGEVPRTRLHYDDKEVVIIFCATGVVNSVLYVKSPEQLEGWDSMSWPQEIPVQQVEPIITGCLTDPREVSKLSDAVREITKNKLREIDWYQHIIGPKDTIHPTDIEDYARTCTSTITFIDGIKENLVTVEELENCFKPGGGR